MINKQPRCAGNAPGAAAVVSGEVFWEAGKGSGMSDADRKGQEASQSRQINTEWKLSEQRERI